MSSSEKNLWLATAENWKAAMELADQFMKQYDTDKVWWQIKRNECERNYKFCMLRATTPKPETQTV